MIDIITLLYLIIAAITAYIIVGKLEDENKEDLSYYDRKTLQAEDTIMGCICGILWLPILILITLTEICIKWKRG